MSAAVRGTMIVIAGRWVDRGLGFVSTLVLARLLVPADFGLVAMAWMVTTLLQTFMDIGIGIQLIQKRDAVPDYYHTGFTLRLVQASVLSLALALVAEPASLYFREPRLELILYALVPSPVLSSFSSIGLLILEKELRYGPEFWLQVAKKVASVIATVAAAVTLESYWALVIGAYVSTLVGVIGSYALHPYRPRLTLSYAGQMWRYSSALFLRGLAGYFALQSDKLIVGRLHASASLGAYQLAEEVALLPASELLAPVNRILLPAFASAESDCAKLTAMFVRALSVSACIGLPTGVGLYVVAPSAIQVLLGAKWIESVAIVQALGWTGVIGSFLATCVAVLLARARFFAAAAMTILQTATFFLMFALLWLSSGASSPVLIASARILGLCICLAVVYGFTVRTLQRGVSRRLAEATWRCIVASAVMGGAVVLITPAEASTGLAMLVVQVSAGAAVYVATLLALWLARGRPDGPESFLLNQLVLPVLRHASRFAAPDRRNAPRKP